ncbi:MAG: hypothetical protein JRJ75_16700 [Deltaproteobacteria bacterium]|nr:hypothetical protein [Deltaproteobacteria bacterium]
MGIWEAEEDWEELYLAELLEERRKRTERLLSKALTLAGRGELKVALIYGRRALKQMRKNGR